MNKNKLKTIKVPTAIPAEMSNFQVHGKSHLSSARLRVLHSDFTRDGRIFTEEMIDGIQKSLGGTPVVAYFDHEDGDFVGHYYDQSVFGFVPEDAVVKRVKEGDRSWLETEVKLFTRRHDVGEVAKKIIGKQQSLELDPSTTEFEVVLSDSPDREFDVIFKKGELIGLSVLGDYQSAAFDGSSFFEESEDAEDLIRDLILEFNKLENEVEIEVPSELFKDKDKDRDRDRDGQSDSVEDAIVEDEDDTSTEPEDIDKPDNPEEEGSSEPEDNDIDPPEGNDMNPPEEDDMIHPDEDNDYSTQEEKPKAADTETEVEETEESEEEGSDDFEESDPSENEPKGEKEEGEEPNEQEELPAEEEGVESEAQEVEADSFALNKAEREELENYRRKHKVSIIDEYKNFLSEETYQDFMNRVDEFQVDSIEKELAFASMQELKKKDSPAPTFMFGVPTPSRKKEEPTDEIGMLVNAYNKKR